MTVRAFPLSLRPRALVGLVAAAAWLAACEPKAKHAARESAGPTDPTAAAAVPLPSCGAEKAPKVFVTSVIQDLSGRQPTAEEIAMADAKGFSPAGFVDRILETSLYDDAVTRFLGLLLRLNDIAVPANNRDPAEAAVVADLKQEPVILVLRNKDKPWKYFFETQDIYCTDNTAKLYDFPLISTPGFVSCKMPPERAGFLGMVSFLRASSPAANPQAFYRVNNNYHRASVAVYLTTGVEMQANTNGPKGDGDGVPMADCAPVDDMRLTKTGQPYGSAAIPMSGANCSTCHSPHMGPLAVAFRRFGTRGELLKPEDLPRLAAEETNATSVADLRQIMMNGRACWSPDGTTPPSEFVGVAGLGKVVAASPTLGKALGVQLPKHLSNRSPTEGMIAEVAKSFDARGGTLKAAMRGYFLSADYRCDKAP